MHRPSPMIAPKALGHLHVVIAGTGLDGVGSNRQFGVTGSVQPWSYMGRPPLLEKEKPPKPTALQRPWSYMGLADRIPKPTDISKVTVGDSPKGSRLHTATIQGIKTRCVKSKSAYNKK
ncbi:hypothetical protein VMCG_10783 [Cytospora schulzeri]|uniref:Uncharacterized protein n=1 Tax=Cytospora schulzeri TaxID=448051 RepID=A0A423V9E5_9PEZI|nr:hypothetical protein VMCG_10783 [Valsa malicola]